jgi:DNA-binding transcriptional LysR family regulator
MLGAKLGIMSQPDLNLLIALDALLSENSVVGAARRLGLSASAMSRTLARLRAATRDPLLAPAGRKMVPTPRAEALRAQVSELREAVQAVLRPAPSTDISRLERTFIIRANDGFVDVFAARLVAAAAAQAPGVRLRFAPKPDKDPRPLREGQIDLDIGVLEETAPELRVQTLFRDVFIGVARVDHPLLIDGPITPSRFVAFGHVVASRRGRAHGLGPVDDALAASGLARTIVAIVPSFPAVFAVASASDLIGLAPQSYFSGDGSNETARRGSIVSFPLPVQTAGITVSQMWHPRHEADAAHRWLRSVILDSCRRAERA